MNDVARLVFDAMATRPRKLPTSLLYDDLGCDLFVQITELDEYYLTRTERGILDRHSAEMCDLFFDGGRAFALAEIGCGTAEKTELLLSAALRVVPHCRFLACDIAGAPLEAARVRLAQRLPDVRFESFVGTHEDAVAQLRTLEERQILLFLGSSIGNYRDDEAVSLLAALRKGIRSDALIVIGFDLVKDVARLESAYNDAKGVTAKFTMNVLSRLNRDAGTDFQLEKFRHFAKWDAQAGHILVGVQSLTEQSIKFDSRSTIQLEANEVLEIEVSCKYSTERIDRIFTSAGLVRWTTFFDDANDFAVVLASLKLG